MALSNYISLMRKQWYRWSTGFILFGKIMFSKPNLNYDHEIKVQDL